MLQISTQPRRPHSRSDSIGTIGSVATNTSNEQLDKSSSPTKSIFGLFRGKSKKEKEPEKEKGLTADMIGDPTDFKHLAHIGFDASTGSFDVKNIPDDWKDVFKKAGISKSQLQDHDTALFIADFIKKNGQETSRSHSVSESTASSIRNAPGAISRPRRTFS